MWSWTRHTLQAAPKIIPFCSKFLQVVILPPRSPLQDLGDRGQCAAGISQVTPLVQESVKLDVTEKM